MHHLLARPASVRRRPLERAVLLAAVALTAPALACSGGADVREPDTAQTAAPGAGPSGAGQNGSGPATAPPPVAPVGPITSSGSQRVPTPAAGGGSGDLVWSLPKGWTEVPPANPMRKTQATIPGAGGPADLVLFHFGPGQGGDARSNVERWLGQMEVEGEPEQGSFESGGLVITWIDVAGTQKPSQMGTGPAEPVPGSRLLGAVVEGPGGPWFFKATGPDATLAAAREDFLAMLRAARVE